VPPALGASGPALASAKHNVSNWAAYKAKHPERVAFYASSTWRSLRDRHLKANPTCVVCGGRASHADHVVSIALGGSQDGQLQSMCARHHHEKTVRDSHEAAKRAAARRKEKHR
jgi:5-methylcytosine-specific restriction endonuclease McrA